MNFAHLLSNKHTSGAALIYLVAAAAGHIGMIWFPHYTNQFDGTIQVIKEFCVVYGMALAGDAKKPDGNGNSTSGTFNTDQLRRALTNAAPNDSPTTTNTQPKDK